MMGEWDTHDASSCTVCQDADLVEAIQDPEHQQDMSILNVGKCPWQQTTKPCLDDGGMGHS